ncbi:MAG: hypothetical protein V2A62_01770 [Candidatus Woesearchaeota archaeon]
MMWNNTQKAVLITILCTLFTSTGQILWKFGIERINLSDFWTILNIPFVLGFIVYALGGLLMLLAFKKGDLSLVYPIIATGYVWVSLLSPLLFPTDSMNVWKWSGVILIMISVSVLGWGSSKHAEVEHG